MRTHTKKQVIVTIVSFAILVGIAAAAPTFKAASNEQPQSFVGTTPDATTVEALPPQF